MISPEQLEQWIADIYEDFTREEDQAVLRRNMDEANTALMGKIACQKLRTKLENRVKLPGNVARMPRGRH